MPSCCLQFALLALPLAAPAAEQPSFTKDVAPLLRARCLKCHAGPRARAGLDLTARAKLLAGGDHGPAVQPGQASKSLLYRHVKEGKMPPRQPLPPGEVEVLRRWIDAGARWQGPDLRPVAVAGAGRARSDWWSLRPVHRPALPPVKGRDLVFTPIDAFLLAALEAKELSFAPEADRRTLVRRLSFDLVGLAPTPEEIDAFERDTRPDAYERLVDRLLASPHHGERWGRHWLDVVRFAESHGYEMNTLRPSAWPYRDYVLRAFNTDLGYADFVRQQLAGDTVPEGDFLTRSATGYLVAGPHDLVGNATREGQLQQRADDLYDLVSTTGTTFLGLTVGCARCHDHKFDPITQKDFYALQAVFAGVEHAERPLPTTGGEHEARRVRDQLAALDRRLDDEQALADLSGKARRPRVDPLRNLERFRPVRARFARFVVLATSDGSEPCIDELELYGPGSAGNLALASSGVTASASSVYPNNPRHRVEHVNDGRHGNARSWISAERGKGWVQLELPRETTVDRVVWGRDREGRYRDRLPRDYRVELSTDGKRWTTVASSTDRVPPGSPPPAAPAKLRGEQEALRSRLTALETAQRFYVGSFRPPDRVHRLERGDVLRPAEEVGPGGIAAIRPAFAPGKDTSEAGRRAALANWIGRPDHPLTWRVLVNRLWHWHFGQGLVSTPSDFGYNGDRPSHPELLDWLAAEAVAQGGRLKPLHRLVVLSRAYRQASRHDARAAAVDAGNRLLWRRAPRRLEAEAVRDAMLQTAGALDRRMGGPGYHLWEYSGYVIVFRPKAKLGTAEFRRMVYQFKPRLQQDGTFGAFDCPDATGSAPRRNVSTTALQALNLLNDPFVLDQAERFAERVRREAGSVVPAQVRRSFRLAFGRPPTAIEAAAAEKLVEAHGLALLCRALFNANEFVYVQ
jgi:hypothetical protein